MATSSFWLAFWHGARVTNFRKAAGVAYPNQFAVERADRPLSTAEYVFNCAQRAHGNFLENQPSFVAAVLLAGLQYPLASAVIGAVWGFCRILFAIGYTRTDKKNGSGRLIGLGFWLCQMALFGMAGKVGFDMIRA